MPLGWGGVKIWDRDFVIFWLCCRRGHLCFTNTCLVYSLYSRNKNEKLHYCLVICQVSSTGHIYHRAAKRRGDKFDWSMTRGKLLDNDTQLFNFISILIMTHLHPRDPENGQPNQFSERRFSKKTVTRGWMGKLGLAYCQLGFIGK